MFIVSLIKGYSVVLDIGTDHGLVLKKALQLKYINKGIAVDIKINPLKRAYQGAK
ncbi:SAM-dependent methyltransferase [Texas Phoenix palm phytoplasma]|nr:SAM-dependent methyltransferase [Texas Phoenix palm phytoplasma]